MKKFLLTLAVACATTAMAQNDMGNITGNLESTFQYLRNDPLIDANQPPEKALINSYANIFYTKGKFSAGARVESYLPRIQGYPDRFDGTGIGFRYIGYKTDFIDLTIGNFYEQFGSGMIFRSYEQRALGYDNAMDGIRLKLNPYKGIRIKGFWGKQRLSFTDGRIINSAGLVRGFDGEMHVNQTFEKLKDFPIDIMIGAQFVSKYQEDDNDQLILPENVGAYGGRIGLRYKGFYLNGEYNIKENDPSSDNGYIYNNGHAALINFGYSRKGLGIVLSAKSTDNMSFRSDRTKDLQDALINFLPPTNKTHTYNLVATLYPYATQLLGEVGYQADIIYTVPKKSKIGGKYGMPININYSIINGSVQSGDGVSGQDSTQRLRPYSNTPFATSTSNYWHDFNVQIKRKFNKKFYAIGSYYNILINNDVIKVTDDAKGKINSHIGVLEMGYKINRKHSLRAEFQALFVNDVYDKATGQEVAQDKGNWATALIEYTISPNWFVSVMDQYNYGNPTEANRIHYIVGSVGYVKGATRIMGTYGRQRAGLFCVGGVCRFVPASNGLTVTLTQSF
ncbi:hypothetical protein SAMN05216474_2529 [Lishizhenia tianjinensis]|uniref:TonB dependent receptor n=1 Tax=Lishizhenia tianjinensis TaxID=477690 RepID=A0A1I7B471_9FLAO|nr:DUF6029 family protein [Lishizhenia tianjinensis]SFT81904.1 hypothetical protein SAMN05216474_2529 [Lishizhenia tianjinensis]